MRSLLLAVVLCGAAGAQMQLPPGTSSALPETTTTAPPTAQAETLQRAEDAISAGTYQTAIKLLAPLATAAQKESRVFYDLGFAQDALGHDAEAATAYRQALQRKPDDGLARVSLGLLLARMGERTTAEQELARAVKTPGLLPDFAARALRALAQMHLEGAPAQASDDLVAALKLSPETPTDAALAAEIAEAQHDDAAALKAYIHAQGMAPADPEIALGYARLLSRQGKHAEAETVLEPARKAHPDHRALTAEYASQELLLNHTEQAVPLLVQLNRAQPSDAAITRLLATAYMAAGELDKAASMYAALLKANPNDPAIAVDWADCLIRQKRSAEAEPVLKHVVFDQAATVAKEVLVNASGMLAFAASSNHDPETVLRALSLREGLIPPTAAYTFLAATAHDTVHHTRQAAEQYRLFLQESSGKFPDQEWQAHQRLQILDRTR